jgi:DNA-binding MarR family transcriptional regulator
VIDEDHPNPPEKADPEPVLLSPADAAEAARLLTILLGTQLGAELRSHSPSGSRLFAEEGDQLVNAGRKAYLARRGRKRFFNGELFGEPAWDILLSLYVRGTSRGEMNTTRVLELAEVPMTTGLRHLYELERRGLIQRIPSAMDKRSVSIGLSSDGLRAMNRYFASMMDKGLAG